MPTEIANQIEAKIRANKPIAFKPDWAQDWIFPQYDGLSIRNVIHSIAGNFGVDMPQYTPLDGMVWDGGVLPDGIDRVVMVVSDGLSYLRLQRLAAEDAELAAVLSDLTGGRGALPLTSITPSTTAAGLSCLWTGAGAAGHGMTGFRIYLREISTLSIPLFFCPAIGPWNKGSLEWDYGLDPEKFVPLPGFAERLAAVGVPTYPLMRFDYMGTGVSKILHRGIPRENWRTHRYHFDKWIRMRKLLAETRGTRSFINVYLPSVDDTAHHYGADSPETIYTIKRQLSELRDVLADEAGHDGRTLFMLTADHGHMDAMNWLQVRKDPRFKTLWDSLRLFLGGEGRIANLYLRPGTRQQVTDLIDGEFADVLTWLDPEEALAAGLYGPEPVYEEVPHRLGDLILLPRAGYLLDDFEGDPPLISWHGGMDPQEMLVPLLWKKL